MASVRFVGAVLINVVGGETVTEIVNCAPLASDTVTVAAPPVVPDSAEIVSKLVPAGIDALTSPALVVLAV